MRNASNTSDWYAILQVHESAEPEVIEAVYKRLARKSHPDVNSSPNATVMMQRLNDAYAILGDPLNRHRGNKSDRQRTSKSPWESRWAAVLGVLVLLLVAGSEYLREASNDIPSSTSEPVGPTTPNDSPTPPSIRPQQPTAAPPPSAPTAPLEPNPNTAASAHFTRGSHHRQPREGSGHHQVKSKDIQDSKCGHTDAAPSAFRCRRNWSSPGPTSATTLTSGSNQDRTDGAQRETLWGGCHVHRWRTRTHVRSGRRILRFTVELVALYPFCCASGPHPVHGKDRRYPGSRTIGC